MKNHSAKNRLLLRSVWLPTIFLTVALTGGLRVDAATRAFLFLPPALITLLLAVLLVALFVRGQLIVLRDWFSPDAPPLANFSHALTLITIFFASAQAINSVLPESGLLHWLFSFFFLWTLWNNQFSAFDARRLLRSLAVLFGTAFILKYILLAGLYADDGDWRKKIAGAIVEGLSLGTLAPTSFAPATGYLSFFTLALYVTGLGLLIPAAETSAREGAANQLLRIYERLSPRERARVQVALIEEAQINQPPQLQINAIETAEINSSE